MSHYDNWIATATPFLWQTYSVLEVIFLYLYRVWAQLKISQCCRWSVSCNEKSFLCACESNNDKLLWNSSIIRITFMKFKKADRVFIGLCVAVCLSNWWIDSDYFQIDVTFKQCCPCEGNYDIQHSKVRNPS